MAAPGVRRRAGGRFRARETRTAGADGYFLAGNGGAAAAAAVFSRILEGAGDSAPASGPAAAVDAPATAAREAPVSPAASAAAARVTPAVLFVTVVLAVVLLVSGLLHVLRRLFLKSNSAAAGGRGERHLQHLFFPAHDDAAGSGSGGGGGLAQSAIDALPEFAYAELSSAAAAAAAAASRKGKEKAARPFDCAVCLCEFADHDRLRLLPACGHAFHVACIDVWLRSSATCPLCRTKLSARPLAATAATDDALPVGPDAEEQQNQQDQAPSEAAAASSVVLPVRLGRFAHTDGDDEASTSTSSRIDARRCYSMGSYQYVLADDHLLVSVHMRHGNVRGAGTACGTGAGGAATSSSSDEQQQQQGKKVIARGDSFSVSKIWQWRGSKRLAPGFCADDSLPWAPAAKDSAPAGAHTRQQRHGDS